MAVVSPRNVLGHVFANAMSVRLARDHGVDVDVKLENELQDGLATLLEIVQRMRIEQRKKFKMQNDGVLRETKNILARSRNPHLRSYHDRIFTNLLGYPIRTPMQVTEIYDAFVKGIFTFQGEDSIEYPSYHRDRACGPKANPNYKATHTCKVSNSAHTIKNNKRMIENCYIERQLYDKMFNHYNLLFDPRGDGTSSQNDGHINMLHDVRVDFESCFPNVAINVEIFFESREHMSADVPVQVDITWTTVRLSQQSRKVTFARTLSSDPLKLYDDFVLARDHGRNGTMYRIQSYDNRNGVWKKDKQIERLFEEYERSTRQALDDNTSWSSYS
jgi:hypothetical protein